MPHKPSTHYTPPFTIAVDSREQAPYTFENLPPTSIARGKPMRVLWEYVALPEGDYSIVGFPHKVVSVERKSLQDLYNTLGQHRERFEREIVRLNEYEFAAVVIEAEMREICNPQAYRRPWRSQLHPRSVFENISSWEQRYPNVHWIAAGSRRLAEIKVFSILQKAHKRVKEREKDAEDRTLILI